MGTWGWRVAGWLVLPLAALLAAQWPLRTVVQGYAAQANDAAQIVFALYMAVAVAAAMRAGVHLAASHAKSAGPSAAHRFALAACLLPWALFLLWTTFPAIRDAVLTLEKFAETLDPGYFVIKLALWLLPLLVVGQVLRTWPRRHR